MKKVTSISLAALALSAQAFAIPNEVNAPQVVVSASRVEESFNKVPANIKLISREDIVKSGATSIPQILSQLGGLLIRGNSLGQFNIDAVVDMGGYGSTATSNTLILLNGQRINPADSGGASWESIALGSIDRIEIVHGGSSVQYGNGATGGVINIITNQITTNRNIVSVTAGSFGTRIFSASLSHQLESDLAFQLNASSSNTDGWRQNSAADVYTFNGKITKKLNGNDRIYLDILRGRSDIQTPGGVLGQIGLGDSKSVKFNNVGSTNKTDNIGFTLGSSFNLSDKTKFEGEVFYKRRTINTRMPYYRTDDSVYSGDSSTWHNPIAYPCNDKKLYSDCPDYGYATGVEDSKSTSWDLYFTPRVNFDSDNGIRSVIGWDYGKSKGNSQNSYGGLASQTILLNQHGPLDPNANYYNNLTSNIQSADVTNNSVYFISRVPLTNSLELSGGGRRQVQDISSNDLSINSPNGAVSASNSYSATAADIALTSNYAPGQKLYVKWNQSFRFANLDELWGFNPISQARIFSGALKPQVGKTYEAGGSWTLENALLSATVFNTDTYDEIRYNTETYYNANSPYTINRKGVTFDINSYITSKLNVGLGGKFQNTEYTSGVYSGKQLALAPTTLLNVRALYKLDDNWSLGGVINFVGTQYYDSNPPTTYTLNKMPSYAVTDLFAAYKNGRWDGRLTIKNITNENYATYGGYGFVGLPGASGGDRYYYYPSDPRSVFATLSYNF